MHTGTHLGHGLYVRRGNKCCSLPRPWLAILLSLQPSAFRSSSRKIWTLYRLHVNLWRLTSWNVSKVFLVFVGGIRYLIHISSSGANIEYWSCWVGHVIRLPPNRLPAISPQQGRRSVWGLKKPHQRYAKEVPHTTRPTERSCCRPNHLPYN